MSRSRKPSAVLEMNGSFNHNPDRRKKRANEPKPEGTIGNPPEHLSTQAADIWHEICGDVTWLTCSDRVNLEVLCILMERLRTDLQAFRGQDFMTLLGLLRALGMTPADRSKVQALPKMRDKDAWAELIESQEAPHNGVQ